MATLPAEAAFVAAFTTATDWRGALGRARPSSSMSLDAFAQENA